MFGEKDLSNKEWEEIGNRIRARRKSCNIKQSELAEKIGISLSHMSGIENGRQHPSIYVLIRLSEILGVTPDYFLLGNIRTHNIPQNIVETLYLCDESMLPLVDLIVKDISKFSNILP